MSLMIIEDGRIVASIQTPFDVPRLTTARDAPHIINKAASDNLRNDIMGDIPTIKGTTPIKIMTAKFINGFTGRLRTKITMYNIDTGYTLSANYKKNAIGSYIGTQENEASQTPILHSQDITVIFQPGDTIDLYAWRDDISGSGGTITTWKLYYDDSPTVTISAVVI